MRKKVGMLILGISGLGIVIFLILFFNIPRIKYTYVDSFDAYFVTKAYGDAKTYEIHEEYKGKKVEGIGTRAFYKHQHLKSLNLPEGIRIIERLAFSECEKLENINLEKVETIYRGAFSYCKSLKEITISAKDIGGSAFYKCSSLEKISLNSGVKSIGSMAFSNTNIVEITLPKSVRDIYADCFYECKNLKKIYADFSLSNDKYLNGLDIVEYIE